MITVDLFQIVVITSPIWMDQLIKAIYRNQMNKNRSLPR